MIDEPPIHLAREIVNIGQSPDGIVVLTTFSQAQIDEMLAERGVIGWLHSTENAELTIIRTAPDYRPLVTFALRRGTHRCALRDALTRRTIRICAAESLQDGMIGGKKIAIDLSEGDLEAIRMALSGKLPGLRP